MDWICPICNGLEKIEKTCPSCGATMADGGRAGGYLGPYSPYMENTGTVPDGQDRCMHLAYCPDCGANRLFAFSLIAI